MDAETFNLSMGEALGLTVGQIFMLDAHLERKAKAIRAEAAKAEAKSTLGI